MTNSFDQFAADLAKLLRLSETKSVRLAELLDDRIKELAEEKASDALDREFNRGNYRW